MMLEKRAWRRAMLKVARGKAISAFLVLENLGNLRYLQGHNHSMSCLMRKPDF